MKLFNLENAAILRFTGEDHAEFLQSQGTADLAGNGPFCRYSLWLDHKGIIQADAFVLRENAESVLLISYALEASALREKFERHIIADDVEIADLSARYAVYAVRAAESAEALDVAGLEAPAAGHFQQTGGLRVYPGRRLDAGSVDFLVPLEANPFSGLPGMELAEAEALRIQTGFPLVPQDTLGGGLNPIEANLVSAVSFDKGCYLGQEVVARVHRLQRVSRRLVRIRGESAPSLMPMTLTLEGKETGALSSVAMHSDGFIGIGWLKSKVETGRVAFDQLEASVETLPAS